MLASHQEYDTLTRGIRPRDDLEYIVMTSRLIAVRCHGPRRVDEDDRLNLIYPDPVPVVAVSSSVGIHSGWIVDQHPGELQYSTVLPACMRASPLSRILATQRSGTPCENFVDTCSQQQQVERTTGRTTERWVEILRPLNSYCRK
jgi:hypothetical protein